MRKNRKNKMRKNRKNSVKSRSSERVSKARI